jgi:hypothetical protein
MDFGTFSEIVMDFSEGEFGSFGGFVLILFRGSDGNPNNFRKKPEKGLKTSALILE